MSVSVRIPAPLRQFTAGQRRVEVEGADLASVLAALVARHPELEARLFAAPGQLRPDARVFIGSAEPDASNPLASPVPDGGEVSIVPPIAGA